MDPSKLTLLGGALGVALLGSGHCFGMCGGLAALAGVRRAPEYHLGRGTGYAAIGAIAGASGQGLFLIFRDRPEWSILLVVAFLAAIALQTIRVWNGSADASWAVRLPRAILRKIGPLPRILNARSRGPFGYGLASAFIPCGWFAYFGMIAASTGSATYGALVFLMLWLGSVPALLAAATTVNLVRRRFPGQTFRRLSAVILLLTSMVSLAPRFSSFERAANAAPNAPVCGFPSGH